jgi:CBS domain containing-hemolysin-like protein
VFHDSLLVLVALLLVLLNGFFVAAEFGIVKLRATRVAELQAIGGWRGPALARVHRHLDAYLSACQLGITLASLGLGWIGEPAFAHLVEKPLSWLGLHEDRGAVEATAFVIAFTLISFLHIVVGELAPKSVALRRAESVSLWTAVPLLTFYWLMYPFIWLLNLSANLTLRAAGLAAGSGHEQESPHSLEEMRALLHYSRASLGREAREINALASHALELPELDVSELMRPLREMVAIHSNWDHAEVRALVRRHRYSRYPLLGASGEVLGVLHIKDILLEQGGAGFGARLRRHLHPPLQVREEDSAASLLHRFRQGSSHFALVRDRDVQLSGFLTLEDVLEAILGEITDEHEARRTGQVSRRPLRLKNGELLARGDTPIYLVERELGRPIAGSGESNTLAGLVMQQLDRVPQEGETVELDGLRIKAARVSGARVESVRVREVGNSPARNFN